MSENPNKLRLKSTDTNRFKVDQETEKPKAAPVAAQDAQPPKPTGISDPSSTQAVADPISLRDTATGRLKKLSEDKQGRAAAFSVSGGANLTNRTPGAVPLRIVQQDASSAPAAAAPAQKLNLGSVKDASEQPAAPAPAAAAPAPAKPMSSTIRLAIKKPGAPAAAPAPAPAAAAPAAAAPAPAEEKAAAPAAVGAAIPNSSNTMKIRPAGSSAQAAPAEAAEAKPAEAPKPAETPKPVVPSADGRRSTLKLKKVEPHKTEVSLPPGAAPAPEIPVPPPAKVAEPPVQKAPEPPKEAKAPASSSAETQANPAAKTQAPSASATTSAKLLKAQSGGPNYEMTVQKSDDGPGAFAAVAALLAMLAGVAAVVFSVLTTTGYLN